MREMKGIVLKSLRFLKRLMISNRTFLGITLIFCISGLELAETCVIDLQDQTSSRPNTLSDDADDIQRQLDNEARDRVKFGRPNVIWVFKFPIYSQGTLKNSLAGIDENNLLQQCSRHSNEANFDLNWDYKSQKDWPKVYPDCGGYSQSPVDIYPKGLIKAHGARPLKLINFDVSPKSWTLRCDENKIILQPCWKTNIIPYLTGGAIHSRRYKFDSIHIHMPSEHTVGSIVFPLETQTLFVSAEYDSIKEAASASKKDFQAILGIASLYKFSNHTQTGLEALIQSIKGGENSTVVTSPKFSSFCPRFTKYAFYQGSLTYPPCTQTVAWLLRAHTLSIKREDANSLETLFANKNPSFRQAQQLNERKIYLFS